MIQAVARICALPPAVIVERPREASFESSKRGLQDRGHAVTGASSSSSLGLGSARAGSQLTRSMMET